MQIKYGSAPNEAPVRKPTVIDWDGGKLLSIGDETARLTALECECLASKLCDPEQETIDALLFAIRGEWHLDGDQSTTLCVESASLLAVSVSFDVPHISGGVVGVSARLVRWDAKDGSAYYHVKTL